MDVGAVGAAQVASSRSASGPVGGSAPREEAAESNSEKTREAALKATNGNSISVEA